jgi:acetyl-CoA acetyltransferase
MKMHAYVAGVGMTKFGNHLTTKLKDLAAEAIRAALADAGIAASEIQAAYMGNASAGVIQGQEMIRGQAVLRAMGIGKIPVINLENACATSSTAFQQAAAMVTFGAYDVVLVCGYEKLFHEDKKRSFLAFDGAVDTEDPEGMTGALKRLAAAAGESVDAETEDKSRSVFVDIYGYMTKAHMKNYGTTREQIAGVTAKNSRHGALNPRAQFQKAVSVEEVLAAREIVWPLTLPMCSPIGDGAAAVVLVSERKAKAMGLSKKVRVMSSALVSGFEPDDQFHSVGAYAVAQAYESAGIGPKDIDFAEVHDASATSEIIAYEYLQLCEPGGGGKLIESGYTALGGKVPVNASGGLLRKGHPIGATGAAPDCRTDRTVARRQRRPSGSGGTHRCGAQRWRHDRHRCRRDRCQRPWLGALR